MARVVLVSNRLPVTLRPGGEGGQRIEASTGGLVAGLQPLHDRSQGIWIGHPGITPDEHAARALAERRLVPVDVPEDDYEQYYDGYANSALWPLFHYLVDRCEFDPDQFAAYQRVNERFAATVVEHARPGDQIWVHDYQLMLVPQLVRREIPDARIGFFLHIPFPSSEVFRVLPQRERILRGLLGADLVGVHTFEYGDHLARSIRRVLGFESRWGRVQAGARNVFIESHPLGIDVESLREQAFSPEADRRLERHREWVRGRQVILGVDRLDYTKGLPLKLAAFARLLDRSPRWCDEVVFIQLAVPTRENIEGYREQRAEVEQLVGQINGSHGRPGRIPVQYLYRSVEPAELGALYRLADVAYVAPIRDGLNLVAKEFIACHDDGTGVLLVSEFAGAASELGEALRINPWDVEGTVDQLERALLMSAEERAARMRPMYARVRSGDVHRWVSRFMRSLEDPSAGAGTAPPMLSAKTLAESMADAFARARSPLLMLDYGGTLRELTAQFDLDAPTGETLAVLAGLTALEGVTVVVHSGRDRDTVDRWFRDVPVSLVAEHGTWLRSQAPGSWRRVGLAPDEAWKREARPVLEEYTQRVSGTSIEDRSASLVWHYGESQSDDEWLTLELTSVLETRLRDASVEVLHGARMIEVRPLGLNKALAFNRILEEFGPFDFVLVAGDDPTDEDLFRAAESRAATVRVGAGASVASAAVSSPRSLRELLQRLADARAAAHEAAS